MKYTCLIVFALNVCFGWSQADPIEALKEELRNHQKQDTTRVKIWNDLAYAYYIKDINATMSYVDSMEVLSKALSYDRGMATTLALKGMIANRVSNYKEALGHLKGALHLFESLNDDRGIAMTYNAIGATHLQLSNYKEALENLRHSYELFETLKMPLKMVPSLLNIGSIYSLQGDYTKAIFNYKEALKISEAIEYQDGIAYCLSNLGHIYKDQGNYPFALDYYHQGLYHKKKMKDTLGISISLNSIGSVYRIQEDYDAALDYHQQSLALQLKNGNKGLIATNKSEIGLIYVNKGAYDKALTFFEESLAISRAIGKTKQEGVCLNHIGNIYVSLEQPAKALDYFKASKIISLEIGDKYALCGDYLGLATAYFSQKRYEAALEAVLKSKALADTLELLNAQKEIEGLRYQIYQATHRYKEALISHEYFKLLNDSLFNKKNVEKITQLEYEYKYKEALEAADQRESELTSEVIAVNNSLEQSQRNVLMSVIVLLTVALILTGIIFFLKLRNAKALTENIRVEQRLLRSQMSPHFVFNALSVLQGMVLHGDTKQAITYLAKFSKLLRITLENSRDKMVPLSQELLAVENYVALQNIESEQAYIFKIKSMVDTERFKVPPMLIQPFVENAIEHAFEEAMEEKTIDIQIDLDAKTLVCTIIDNGIGLDSYKQTKTSRKKSLATIITSERLEMLSKDTKVKGAVKVEDRKQYGQRGTLVTLVIPYKN